MSVEIDYKTIFDTALDSPSVNLPYSLNVKEEKKALKDITKKGVQFLPIKVTASGECVIYYYVRPDGHFVIAVESSTQTVYSYLKINPEYVQDEDDGKDDDDDDYYPAVPILPNLSGSIYLKHPMV